MLKKIIPAYSYLYWACFRLAKLYSETDKIAQWKAKTAVFCLNIQLIGWVWIFTGRILKRNDLITASNMVLSFSIIISLSVLFNLMLLKETKQSIQKFESYRRLHKFLLDFLVVLVYIVVFYGIILIVNSKHKS